MRRGRAEPAAALRGWPQRIHVLIPAYKAAVAIGDFLGDLLEVVPAGNVCVVDDGSFDDTFAVCRRLSVRCLINDRNMGKGASLKRGFDYLVRLGAQWILTMDADGQHAVSDIPGFIATMELYPDAGLIIGARSMHRGRMPLSRILSNRITSGILSMISGRTIHDSQSGYRLYSRELLQTIPVRCPRFEMESEVILRACASSFDIRFVSVQTLYLSRQSHISHLNDTVRWVRAVVGLWWELRKQSVSST